MYAIGAHRDAKCIEVFCPGIDCEGHHSTYDVTDVLLLQEGVIVEEAQEYPNYEEALEQHLGKVVKGVCFPTVLGTWFGNVCDN